MVVLAVVALLLAVAAPSFVSLAPVRKTAAAELVGVLETARTQASALGQEVHVAFADGSFPVASDRHRAYAIFTADPDAEPGAEAELAQTSPWYRLPEGIAFGRSEDFESVPEAPLRTLQESAHRLAFPVATRPGASVPVSLPCVSFGPRGEIVGPDFTEADALHLGVVEGFYEPASGGVRLTRTRPGRSGGGAYAQGEIVGLAYYTGRASVLTD